MWHVTSITSERIPQSTPCVRATSRDSPREWRVCRRRRRPALVLAAAAAAAAQPGTSGDFNTCPQTKDQGGRSRSHSGSQPESLKVDIRSSGFAFIPYAAKQPHKFYSRKKNALYQDIWNSAMSEHSQTLGSNYLQTRATASTWEKFVNGSKALEILTSKQQGTVHLFENIPD